MSNYYYAEIDNNNTVFGISELHSEETSSTLISITLYDTTLIGKQYDSVNKVFNAPAQTLDQAKQAKKESLLASLNASFTTFQSSALGSVHTYPIDLEAQNNLDRLQQRATLDANKNDFNFKTIEDGTLVLHTRAQFLVLLQDAETFIVTQTKHYDSLVAQVNAATDVATVQAITW